MVKTCQTCRDYNSQNRVRYRCEHGRQRHHCKDCNGSSVCERQRVRILCKDCNGASICEYQRHRSTCKAYNGTSICEHQRQQSQCIDCQGASICRHSKQRYICRDCNGTGICAHSKERITCLICDPICHLSGICRSRIYKALKSDRELTSREYIGCSIEEFKQHIRASTQTTHDMGKPWNSMAY